MWTEEGIEHNHRKCKGWVGTQEETGKIWEEMRDKIKRSIRNINKKVVIWKLGRKIWHSKAWTEKKRELRREMRKMRKGKIDREEYIRRRKEYRK